MVQFNFTKKVNTIRLFEQMNTTRINYLIHHHSKELNRETLRSLKTFAKINNSVAVSYDHGKDSYEQGRLYASKGLQYMPSTVRNFISCMYYRDVDFANCNPTILLELCKMFKYDCPLLTDYCENRDKYLDEYSKKLNSSRKSIKHAILTIIFGRGITNIECDIRSDLSNVDLFINLKNETRQICDLLVKNPAYKSFVDYIKSKKGKKSHNVSIMCYIIQNIECEMLLSMKTFFEEKGYKIGTLIFDGFLVESEEQLPDELLTQCESHLKSEFGISMKLVEKPMKSTFTFDENNYKLDHLYEKHGVITEVDDDVEFDVTNSNYDYKTQKKLFEKRHFKVTNPTMYIMMDQNMSDYTEFRNFNETYNDVYYTKIIMNKLTMSYEKSLQPFYYNNNHECWMRDSSKRRYRKLVFNPDPDYVNDGSVYNTFTGYKWPKNKCIKNDKNIEPMLYHIKHRWCQDDEKLYNYVIRWMAFTIQRPHIRAKTTIVLRSQMGSGKGIVVQLLANIIGEQYFLQPTGMNDVLGNFNSLCKNKLILFMDELMWSGNHEAGNKLKKLITEPTISISQKYTPTQVFDNNLNLIIASNEEWVVPAGLKARRFCCLETSEELCGKRTQEKQNIINELASVKPEHFGYFLFNYDISDFNIEDVPITGLLKEQKAFSASPLIKFVHDLLYDGHVYHQKLDDVRGVLKSDIYDYYQKSRYFNKHKTKSMFWKEVKKYIKFNEFRTRHQGSQLLMIRLSNLNNSRTYFEDVTGLDGGWDY